MNRNRFSEREGAVALLARNLKKKTLKQRKQYKRRTAILNQQLIEMSYRQASSVLCFLVRANNDDDDGCDDDDNGQSDDALPHADDGDDWAPGKKT